jgi:DNA-binding NarL/FixJ family response regulator
MQTCCTELRFDVLIYSDEGVLGVGAASLLSSTGRFDVTLATTDLASLIPLAQRTSPDVILIDLNSEITLGFLSALRLTKPAVRIILWGRHFSEELANQAREMGGIWFLRHGHSRETFLEDFSRICAGAEPVSQRAPEGSRRVALTPREAQLITLLAQGLSNKEIGGCLGITEGTVRIYLTKLFLKVGAKHRFELAVFGLKNLHCGQASWDGLNTSGQQNSDERARPVLRSLFLVEPRRRSGYAHIAKTAS